MGKLIELVNECPGITVSLMAGDLKEFADYFVSEAKKMYEAKQMPEQYVKRIQTAEQLGVNVSTLWRYERAKILCPVRIGGKRVYKQSDIDKILMKN